MNDNCNELDIPPQMASRIKRAHGTYAGENMQRFIEVEALAAIPPEMWNRGGSKCAAAVSIDRGCNAIGIFRILWRYDHIRH